MHDAIHAVREQQGRAVTRSLLNQQKAIAASKLQCNIQIKRTSTPEHPPMSNVPSRRARARSEKANGVTSGSSEESDSEPQTSRMARFQALKMRFETPKSPRRKANLTEHSKGKGFTGKHPPEVPQIARPKSIVLQDPPEEWMAQPLKVTEWDHQAKKTSRIVDIVHRLLMGSKVKVIWMATRGALVSQYSELPCFS